MKQRDVPGIDVAYLAMDNETGELFLDKRSSEYFAKKLLTHFLLEQNRTEAT